MTVSELIRVLREFPQDAYVVDWYQDCDQSSLEHVKGIHLGRARMRPDGLLNPDEVWGEEGVCEAEGVPVKTVSFILSHERSDEYDRVVKEAWQAERAAALEALYQTSIDLDEVLRDQD
jgi:hypothetical protein